MKDIKRLVENEMELVSEEVLDETGECLDTYDVDSLIDLVECKYNLSRQSILKAIKEIDEEVLDQTGESIFVY